MKMEQRLEEELKQWRKERGMSNITATEYQTKAAETAIFPKEKALEYLTLGLVGESGEIANKVKKLIRDGADVEGYNDKLVQIANELGDVLWYCAMLANELDANMGRIMEGNLHKLADRKNRGVLGGSGDNR
jgi:NTP pyrophosphatase (non-canonical NTP hydrolase)